jgi:5-oxoprolinase (ATP-hydrolysing)
VIPPYGLAFGEPGELGKSWVERRDGTLQTLGSAEQTEVFPGDVFVISTPSGGGFGRADRGTES